MQGGSSSAATHGLSRFGGEIELESAKVARWDRQRFDCATWLHKAREMPKEQFKQEVEKELTGKETEPWESTTSNSTRASMLWWSERLRQRL